MSENGERKHEIILLVDEEGEEHGFNMLDRFNVGSSDYAILAPVINADIEEEGEMIEIDDKAYIFRIDLEEGEEVMVEVEDELEWNEVAAVWEERAQDIDFENQFNDMDLDNDLS